MNKYGTIRETHIGIVTENADPEQRGRIKVRCDTLMGTDTSLPDYVEPLFPYLAGDGSKSVAGWFFVPDIGVAVELEITSSSARDESYGAISIDAPQIRWRACTYSPGADQISDEFKGDNYPNRRGIMTSSGHGILFDDTPGDPEVKVQQVNSNGTSFLDFDQDGSAMLLTSRGMLLYMNQADDEISLVDVNGNALVMIPDGWYITDAAGNTLNASGQVFSIFASQTLLVNGTLATFNVAGMSVSQNNLDSAVLIEGTGTPLSVALAAALSELVGLAAILGVPATNASALATALGAGLHTSDLLSAE